MDNQSILICLPLIFIQNERLWGFKRTSENIGVLPARKHEYDNKRIFFSPHWENLFQNVYILLNRPLKFPPEKTGWLLADTGEYDNPAEA